MNTLNSWIDAEAVSGLGQALSGPVGPLPLLPEGCLPLTKLSVEDFRSAAQYEPAAFPAEAEADVETGVVGPVPIRELLRNLREKADRAGLIPGARGVVRVAGTVAAENGEPEVKAAVEGGVERERLAGEEEEEEAGGVMVPAFAAPLGTLSTRVRAFMDWVRRQVTSHDLFIADGQGNPVTDRGATVELVTAALLMAEAARKALRHFASADEGGGGVVLDLPDERKLCVIGADTTHGVFCLGLVLDDALAPRVAQRFRQALKKAIESDEPRRERW
jgi:hypothetical protein